MFIPIKSTIIISSLLIPTKHKDHIYKPVTTSVVMTNSSTYDINETLERIFVKEIKE